MKIVILITFLIMTLTSTSEAKSIFMLQEVKVKAVRLTKNFPINHIRLFRPIKM